MRPDLLQPFKRQCHKMVRHTQTIRRQIADKFLMPVPPDFYYDVDDVAKNSLFG